MVLLLGGSAELAFPGTFSELTRKGVGGAAQGSGFELRSGSSPSLWERSTRTRFLLGLLWEGARGGLKTSGAGGVSAGGVVE